ncbi:SOS response-associated peptidase [Bdellovibrio bacteriovorus]|uniref:SOS response-associated peptidase n=1 Tax=Bdellovibrio bacteriovorus TaxID=959 RepID=UPI003AA834EF
MCASYHVYLDSYSLIRNFKIKLDFEFQKYLLPHSEAPVIVQENNENVLKMMRFSLLPSWSKEAKVKFATHNARLDTIDKKPTWKRPFMGNHCLVPIEAFVEPIYENEHAGNMVRFSRSSGELLVAAGIYDIWTNKETGEQIESFSIITHEPPAFIAEVGHDRCPLFLPSSAFDAWLENRNDESQKIKDFLLQVREDVQFKVEIERPLKSGWEKRIGK